LPLALAVAGDLGGSSTGFGAGAAFWAPLPSPDAVALTVGVHYQYLQDILADTGGERLRQNQSRIGLLLGATWPGAPAVSPTGELAFTLRDASDGRPLGSVPVDFEQGGRTRALTTSEVGDLAIPNLAAGPFSLAVRAPGYAPAQAGGLATAGQRTRVDLRLRKPVLGTLDVEVTDKPSGAPVAQVDVAIQDVTALTDDNGLARVDGLRPGATVLRLTAPGYRPAEEAATVVAGKHSPVAIALEPSTDTLPATVSGQVRSIRGGEPLVADLEVPVLKLKARTAEDGGFSFTLKPGTYRIIISAPGYRGQVKQFTLRGGDHVIFNVDLFPP
jgi:hypothetical protein